MIWAPLIAVAIVAAIIIVMYTRGNKQLLEGGKGAQGIEDPWDERLAVVETVTSGNVIQIFDDDEDQSFQKSGAFAGWPASGSVRLVGDEWFTATDGLAKEGDVLPFAYVNDNAIRVTTPGIPSTVYVTVPDPTTGVERLGTDEDLAPCDPTNDKRGISTAWRETDRDLKLESGAASDEHWTVSGDDISPNSLPLP